LNDTGDHWLWRSLMCVAARESSPKTSHLRTE
jgi:hypothetical protein